MDTHALTSADSTSSSRMRYPWVQAPPADAASAAPVATPEADTSSSTQLTQPLGARANRYYDPSLQALLFDDGRSLEERDELGDTLYDRIVSGRDFHLAHQLLSAVVDPEVLDERKALALELVASTKLSWVQDELLEALLQSLRSLSSELRFAAIASAGFLSRPNRLAIRGAVTPLTQGQSEADEQVRAAATAFLRRS